METLTFMLLSVLILGFFLILALGILILLFLFFKDKTQEQHAVLRRHPVLARVRYFAEKISPEIKDYFGDKKLPFSKEDYTSMVKASKYLSTTKAFGSDRDFDKGGFFLKNSLFAKKESDLRFDRDETTHTKKYHIDKEGLFSRKEHIEDFESNKFLLKEEDAIILGETTCKYPFKIRSLFGMSGMSYGALGENAIQALSLGINNAGGSWMNTGEGGLSEHHLKGGADIIFQFGPAKFGLRNEDGTFSWEKLKEKSKIEQVKAFEIKLGQGAKIRGGKLPGEKVTPEIAKIRGVEPWKTVDSPNSFEEFSNEKELLDFITKIRNVTGKPVGIKIVLGGEDSLENLLNEMKDTGKHPDFISVDGSEGGTGAASKTMMDSLGMPIKPAILILDEKLKEYGFRDKIKIIASGKLIHADKIAVALTLGADLCQLARGYMVSLGCILSQLCNAPGGQHCPVGIATTSKSAQRALVVGEKRFRVTNYILTLRYDLFALAAACGLDTPAKFNNKHVVYVDEDGKAFDLKKYKVNYLIKD